MFSTLLAFGLSAMALVRAAPAGSFPAPMLSCSVNLNVDSPQSVVKPASTFDFTSFSGLETGVYQISNMVPFGGAPGQLRVYGANQPVVVGQPFGAPSTTAMWSVVSLGGNEYTISNFRSKTATRATSQGNIITAPGPGDAFTISPAGEGVYTIKVPNEDKVWAISDDSTFAAPDSPVYLKPQDGELDTVWMFKRL